MKHNLKSLRALKGLSGAEVQAKTGIHQSKVSLYESGLPITNEEHVLQLADLYGVSKKQLLEAANNREE